MCRLLLGSKKAILDLHRELKSIKRAPASFGKYSNWWWEQKKDTETPSQSGTYKDGLTDLLLQLEQSLGGHGNGLALIKDPEGRDIEIIKGTNVEPEQCAELMLKANYRYAVFHTRMASAGDISDANCHPFHFYINRKKRRTDLLVAQNGTESTFSFGTFYGGKTDCEAIARTVLALGLPVPKSFAHWSSVFVGTKNGRPFFSSGSGSLRKYNHKKELLVCSELPYPISTPVESGLVWSDGKIIYQKPKATAHRTYHYTYTPYDDCPTDTYITPKPTLARDRDPYIEEDKKNWTPAEISLYERTGITPYDTD